jgi:hypothetical protein
LTLLALWEILITLVSLTEVSGSSVADDLGPHTATRRCCDGQSRSSDYAGRRGASPSTPTPAERFRRSHPQTSQS